MPCLTLNLPRSSIRYLGYLLVCHLLLTSCSSTPSTPAEPATNALSDAALQGQKTAENAILFDRFLADELTQEEKDSLVASCSQNADANIFCISVLNKSTFEIKQRQHPSSSSLSPHRNTKNICV